MIINYLLNFCVIKKSNLNKIKLVYRAKSPFCFVYAMVNYFKNTSTLVDVTGLPIVNGPPQANSMGVCIIGTTEIGSN